MEKQKLIPAKIFCQYHEVEFSFVHRLYDFGLITLIRVEEEECIDETELEKLEKLARLHYELDINLEGIDVIQHMLNRMQHMQDDILELRNRLKFYEESPGQG